MTSYEKLKSKLAELFQLDQADLDFGIYRIMNAKREEITKFLEDDLLPQVKKAFEEYKPSDKAEIQKELDKVIKSVREAGMDPEQSPKVKALREKLTSETIDIPALENEVYDHLYTFFSRYYEEGDFISQRRYKEGVYAIPYEGEEVKLHWANHDQYYVKTTEYFRDYSFKLPDSKKVHFKIVEADTEKDNIKAANGKDRRFLLYGDQLLEIENEELVIRFEYKPDEEKRKQDAIDSETVKTILEKAGEYKLIEWQKELNKKWRRADGTVSERSILEKHINEYTKRNTFDYFIHKNLHRFLRRELDFYIKNEVMHLDDIEEETAPRVEQYLSKIKVIRMIAHKIIEFLAQIEDFQKKLWLKKKFVIETNYCITLDRIPEKLYPEIVSNNAQRAEWVKLFAINEIREDLAGAVEYSDPLTIKFLKANDKFVLDTRFFDESFKTRLIASVQNIDEQCDGLLIHSENFQSLNLLQKRYQEQVNCIYIDPPFNANSSEIIYKNHYRHSSWLSLIENRLYASISSLSSDFVYVIAIDDVEQELLGRLLTYIFNDNEKNCITIVHNPTGQQGENFSYTHEYAFFIFPTPGKHIGFENREDNPDIRPLRNVSKGSHLRKDSANCFYPIFIKEGRITGFGNVCPDNFHPSGINIIRSDGIIEVYPIDPQGTERKWVFARNTVESILKELKAEYNEKKQYWDIIRTKQRFNYKTVWTGAKYSANSYGSRILNEILGTNPFTFPKSIFTVRNCIDAALCNKKRGIILDYFAGSGTTGHAVINLNREDGGRRKYILVEMADYFNTVLKPRIKKVVYANEWKDGKPVSHSTGISHMFKYIRLESYEDALANIQLKQDDSQLKLLEKTNSFRESYMLKYMLDSESKDSRTLLDIDNFDDPYNYKLLIGTDSVVETKPVNVDLVETFNWLLGLKVRHIDHIKDFRIVEGENLKGEKILIIWRKIRDLSITEQEKIIEARERSNRELEEFFQKQQYNTLDCEFDIIYVNGDNNLMNIPITPEKEGQEPRYKVRLIEEEFKKLMFDVRDI